jgi:tetratricopeptide (TPR) repeat protein
MYQMSVSERDSRYILYCEMKCHVKWIRGEFADAVRWGQRGMTLKKSASNVATQFEVSHALALAERDAGRPERALQIFLSGRVLSEVIDPEELDENRHGSHYGNIGRCLHFMGRIDDALICYQKSALLIEKAPKSEHVINQGYIRRWIGELLFARKHFKLASIFLEAARLKWVDLSPTMANEVAVLQNQLSEQLPPVENLPHEDLERKCRDWILGRSVDID